MNTPAPARKAHVAHVITRLDHGGSATNTIVSADRQREYGFDTTLLYGHTNDPDDSISQFLHQRNISYRYIPCLLRNIAPIQDIKALVTLIRIFRNEKFDLIHTHTSKAGMIGRIAAYLCRIPCVHTPHGHIFYGYFSAGLTAIFVRVERITAHMTKRIISLTHRETQESLERRIGTKDMYVTIPSGVPLQHFLQASATDGETFRRQWHIPGDSIVIASVGRLTAIKGFDILIESFAQLRKRIPDLDFRLLLVGEGEERLALQSCCKACHVSEYVIFTGKLADVSKALKAADFFVLASRNEGMGRAFIEAMACGLPVIGPDTGGVSTVIRHGETGFLIKKEDVEALVNAMETMARDKDFRIKAGAAARHAVDPAYSEDLMIETLCELYHDVLGTMPANAPLPTPHNEEEKE